MARTTRELQLGRQGVRSGEGTEIRSVMPLFFDHDQLIALLHRSAEAPELDYKSTWDPAVKRDLVELCKDIAAMESLPGGGHIVVGATDEGAPSGSFSPADASAFDEQKLRSKIVSVLGEPLEFGSALHEWQENRYLVIAVGPHPDGVRIMQKDGGHKDGIVWQQADVFVRRGTSSTRWNQHEARGIIERIVTARRDQWRADVFETVRSNTPVFDQSGYVNVTAEMPIDVFTAAVTELLRRTDEVGLDLLARKSVKACVDAVVRGRGEEVDGAAAVAEVDQLLNRLDVIAALCARYQASNVFTQVLDGYRTVYAANDEEYLEYPKVFAAGHRVVLVHAFALGAYLVSDRRWDEISALSRLEPVHTHGGYWKTLLHKAEVLAARSESLETTNEEGSTRVGVISNAEPVAERLFALLDEPSGEQITTLLVQFDVYRGIATAGEQEEDKLGAYTNFALYNTNRAEPAFLTALQDQRIRNAIFGAGGDNELRAVFRAMSQVALSEGMRYDGWRGFTKHPLVTFTE